MSFTDDLDKQVGDYFRATVAEHQMTVLHEQDLYRHIRFAKPGTGLCHFDLVTWPGYLTISGDLEAYTFRRLTDMFEFFAGDRQINPVYWSEKLCNDHGRRGVLEFHEDLFRETVLDHVKDHEDEYPGLAAALQEQVFDEDCSFEQDARHWLEQFEHNGFKFSDVWDWEFTYYSHSFLYACYAIQHGVNAYRASKLAVAAS